MPTITISIDPISEEKKQQLVENLTREAVRITGYPAGYFFVYIREYPPENIGVGGKTLKFSRTTDHNEKEKNRKQ
ncbi:MAG TPA: tautomerase family protein [Bacteroidales bacterium]|nr:tautomerase family protein [Bacteroidales bacterium]HPS62672.1 tautomerase family protein [Bacteroidales bacterium]